MSKKDSSLVISNYVPMIGCFVAGFVVSRLMNHQDVVTGDVEEGLNEETPLWLMVGGAGGGVLVFVIAAINVKKLTPGWVKVISFLLGCATACILLGLVGTVIVKSCRTNMQQEKV